MSGNNQASPGTTNASKLFYILSVDLFAAKQFSHTISSMNGHKPTLGLTRISRGHRPPLNPPVSVLDGCPLNRIGRRKGEHRGILDAQDGTDKQRENLISKIEKQLKHTIRIQSTSKPDGDLDD